MAIWDKNKNKKTIAYSKNGDPLSEAFNVNGIKVYPDVDPTDYNFKIMSFNIQSWSGINAWSYIGGIFDDYDTDIIGLQEASASSNLANLGYSYNAVGALNGSNIVYSKTALSNITDTSYQTVQYANKRTFQRMEFAFNGKTIALYNTHLETSGRESDKVAQAGELFNAVQNETYFIITGDFNTVCKSVNATEYTTIMKQFVDAGYNVANCSPTWGFVDTWTDGTTLSGTWYPTDHIITSANIQMSNVVVDTSKIAIAEAHDLVIDHLPIIAYLKIV